jgi:hypothetical protein
MLRNCFHISLDLFHHPTATWFSGIVACVIPGIPNVPDSHSQDNAKHIGAPSNEVRYPLSCIDKLFFAQLQREEDLHRLPNAMSKRAEEDDVLHPLIPSAEHTAVHGRDMTVLKLKARR